MTTLADFHATAIDGQDRDLGDYVGDVVLVVNTASKCGLTPQYEGLQRLYDDYADQGLVVLGFPCDQFGHQEPGTEEEIGAFCQQNYGVSFARPRSVKNKPGRFPLSGAASASCTR